MLLSASRQALCCGGGGDSSLSQDSCIPKQQLQEQGFSFRCISQKDVFPLPTCRVWAEEDVWMSVKPPVFAVTQTHKEPSEAFIEIALCCFFLFFLFFFLFIKEWITTNHAAKILLLLPSTYFLKCGITVHINLSRNSKNLKRHLSHPTCYSYCISTVCLCAWWWPLHHPCRGSKVYTTC